MYVLELLISVVDWALTRKGGFIVASVVAMTAPIGSCIVLRFRCDFLNLLVMIGGIMMGSLALGLVAQAYCQCGILSY